MDQPRPRTRKGPKHGTGFPAADHAIVTERAQDPDEAYEEALSRYGLVGVELAEALRAEANLPLNPIATAPSSPDQSTPSAHKDSAAIDEANESSFYSFHEQSAEYAEEHYEDYRKDPDNPENIDRLIANEMGIWLSTYGPLGLLPYIFGKYKPPELPGDIEDLMTQTAVVVLYMKERYNLPPSLSGEGETQER